MRTEEVVPRTYDPIASATLSSDTTDVTFSSIPGTYTDLRLVTSLIGSGASAIDADYRVNGDTGSNYSWTILYGNGAQAVSNRTSSWSSYRIGYLPANTGTVWSASQIDFMSYANTNVFKTTLVRHAAPNNFVHCIVGTWRSTSAITSITVVGGLKAGSTLSLYGIKAA